MVEFYIFNLNLYGLNVIREVSSDKGSHVEIQTSGPPPLSLLKIVIHCVCDVYKT